jgi:hypothetical protein
MRRRVLALLAFVWRPVAILAASLALLFWADVAAATVPVPPKSGERFRNTATWESVESIIWTAATEAGATPSERRLLLSIAWNESRGRADAVGDKGCSLGLYQIQVGGMSTDKRMCADNRLILRHGRDLPRATFLDPWSATPAALELLRLRGSKTDPDGALASYAGCRGRVAVAPLPDQPPGCAYLVLGRHEWWRQTGLDARFRMLEGTPAPTWTLDDTMDCCECSTLRGGGR